MHFGPLANRPPEGAVAQQPILIRMRAHRQHDFCRMALAVDATYGKRDSDGDSPIFNYAYRAKSITPIPPKDGHGIANALSRTIQKENAMTGRKIAALTVSLAACGLLGTPAGANGLTAEQLVRAGYSCFPAGPDDWIHCLLGRKFGARSIPVKVFSADGNEFLGTELLLRADIYAGQPCPQDGLEQWDSEAVPGYFACHHFETGHH
jgi:hypothetical protein